MPEKMVEKAARTHAARGPKRGRMLAMTPATVARTAARMREIPERTLASNFYLPDERDETQGRNGHVSVADRGAVRAPVTGPR